VSNQSDFEHDPDFEYCGDCCVCGEPVDLSKMGNCEHCYSVFHWGDCGGHSENVTGHACESCGA